MSRARRRRLRCSAATTHGQALRRRGAAWTPVVAAHLAPSTRAAPHHSTGTRRPLVDQGPRWVSPHDPHLLVGLAHGGPLPRGVLGVGRAAPGGARGACNASGLPRRLRERLPARTLPWW